MALSNDRMHTAAAAALATRIPEPTVGKILKALARRELLDSQRGTNGGYTLTRAPEAISVGDAVTDGRGIPGGDTILLKHAFGYLIVEP